MAKVSLRVGLTRVNKPLWASEPQFVSQVNAAIRQIERAVTDIVDHFEDVSEDLMLDVLKPTFDRTQVMVPEATGTLKASGYLEKNRVRNQPRVELGYGRGGFPRYTVIVHENMDMYHAPPTQAKFVQRPMLEDLPDIFNRLGVRYSQEWAAFVGTPGGYSY